MNLMKRNNRVLVSIDELKDNIYNLTILALQCINLLSKGLFAKQIASKLNISIRTIGVHICNVKYKLNVPKSIGIISKSF